MTVGYCTLVIVHIFETFQLFSYTFNNIMFLRVGRDTTEHVEKWRSSVGRSKLIQTNSTESDVERFMNTTH